jgi:hypothetical protein
MYRCETAPSLDDFSAAISALGDEYVPVLARGLEAQADALGVPAEALEISGDSDPYVRLRTSAAELLATPHGLIAVCLEQPHTEINTGSSVLSLYGIGTRNIEQPLAEVAALFSKMFNCKLQPRRYKSDTFKQLVEKGMTTATAPTNAETEGASLLSDAATRRAAIGIASSAGGLLIRDFPKQLDFEDRERADEIRESLEAKSLITTEYVVVCSRNASQVLRAPSREAIAAASDSGARCACGRALTEERIESAVNLDDLGRTLLNGSRWMSVFLIQALQSLGIDYDAIAVEQKAGSDEMDCFADISGELCVFELKDKEFSLGNAYSFGAKVGIHRPRHAIIVTTAQVGNDAKEHFDMAQSANRDERFGPETPSQIAYIEGLDGLVPSLEQLVGNIYAADARQALRSCLPFVSISPASLVAALSDNERTDVAASAL